MRHHIPRQGSVPMMPMIPSAAPVEFESVIPNPKLKLLDQIREAMRLKHYSIRTERCYCDWVRRYIQFHKMQSREELIPAEPKIEVFLSELAIKGNVAVSTQNQAFNALLFLYQQVLHQQVGKIESVRAARPVRVPTVLTGPEVRQVIVSMSGVPQLVVKLIYGGGLRLLEALRLRVHDLDFEMKQLTVRDGKGAKDRYTVLAESVIAGLREHLERVKLTHQADLGRGMARFTCPAPWIENIPVHPGNGAGNTCSRRGICPLIRGPESRAITTWKRLLCIALSK